jgi:uncharacterized repeat protein (TIGR01451 family)
MRQARLAVEAMEDRLLLSPMTIPVTTTADTGAGSLRTAITTADTAANAGSTITFQIPTTDAGFNASTGVWSIALKSALPQITQPMTIDGTSQTNYNGTPLIELNGTGAGTAPGLDLKASSVIIRGLAINRFGGAGIRLLNGSQALPFTNSVIAFNDIGTDPTGTIAEGNGGDGILVTYHNNTNQIFGNVIAGNKGNGIYLNGLTGAPAITIEPNPATSGNVIFHNFIGTNATGTGGLGNALFGININDAPSTQIGGVSAASRNIISANASGGIQLGYGAGTQVQGNYIGTDVTGMLALANASNNTLQAQGIVFTSGSNILVGGTAPGAGNVISGNLGNGIGSTAFLTPIPTNDTVQGNLIGTDATGTKSLGNGGDGISMSGPVNVLIGGNIIASNGGNGINTFPSANGLTIQGNYIGTDVTGTKPMGNVKSGVYIWSPVSVLIGGTSPGLGNVISNNGGDGISTFSANQTLTIQGNAIGTDVSGLQAMGNGGAGINATFANISIGGSAPGAGNIIANNGFKSATNHAGVLVTASPVTLTGNSIYSNDRKGIDLNGGQGNNGQPAPMLSSASSTSSATTVTGTLSAAPGTGYALQFFASTAADAGGFAEGQTFLGATSVVTDPKTGQATINVNLPVPVSSGTLVTATATDPAGDVSEFSAPVVATGSVLLADLGLTLTPNATTVVAGKSLGYTITVTNPSTSTTATGVVVTDVLPADMTYVSSTASQGVQPTQSGNVVTANIGPLPAGGMATVTILVTAGPAGVPSLTDVASVTSQTPDNNLANNVASVTTTVTPTSNVSVAINPLPTNPAIENQPEMYTITVGNTGPNDASGVVLNAVLPTGLTITAVNQTLGLDPVITPGVNGAPSTLTESIGTLGAGSTATLLITGTVLPSAAPQLELDASISTTSPNASTTTSASNKTPVTPNAVLTVAINPTPNPAPITQPLTYNITVTNTGPNAASNVVLTDTLPGNTTYVSSSASQGQVPTFAASSSTPPASPGVVTANLGTVAANSVATVLVTVVPSATSFPSVTNNVSLTSSTNNPNLPANNQTVTATNTTTVIANADLSVVITPSPNPAQVGQPETYVVTVTNNGPSTAAGVVLTDTLDPNVTFGSATATQGPAPTRSGQVITANIGTLNATGVARLTVIGTPTGAAFPSGATTPPMVTNTASATTTTLDPNPLNNTGIVAMIPVNPESILTVTLVPSVAATGSVPAGGALTYTATIKNTGPNDDTNVVFTDTLDPNVTFVQTGSGSSTAGVAQTLAGNVLTANIGTLTAGSTDVETIVVSPNAAAVPTTTNTVTVTGANYDPNEVITPLKNTASATTNVTASADLLLQLNQSPTSALVGQNLTYTIDVTNFGPSDATGVVLTDTLPTTANATFVSGSSTIGATPTVSGNTVTANISALPNGATAVITIVIAPTQAAANTTLTDSASVTATTTDPNTLNNSSSVPISVAPDADLMLTVVPSVTTVQVGQNITYTYTLVNNGPSPATGVAITDPLPTGMSFVSGTATVGTTTVAAPSVVGSAVIANLGTLNLGQTATVTIVLVPSQAALPSVVNTATATTAIADPNPTDGVATVTTPVTAQADLAVAISAAPTSVSVGQDIIYTIKVSNNGPNDAAGAVVNDVLPTSLTFVSATSSAAGVTPTYNPADNSVSAALGTLTAGSSATVTIDVTTTAAAAPMVSNKATVTETTVDPNTSNNSATVAVPILPNADVSVAMATSPSTALVGQNLTYTITVNNNGPNLASAVMLQDVLPASLTFVSATTTQGSAPVFNSTNRTLTAAIGDLSANSAARITLVVTPTGAAAPQVVNTATVTTTSNDQVTSNNIAPVTTMVGASADLSLGLVAAPNTVMAGQNLTYTLTVINNGPSDADNVTITDTLPDNVTFGSATSTAGTMGSASGQTVSIPLGTVTNGSTVTATIVVATTGSTAASIVDNASVASAMTADPNTANNSASATTTVNPAADVGVTIAASTAAASPATSVNAGQNLTYTIVVTNNGPDTATNVMLTNQFPANVTFVPALSSATQGTVPTPGTNNSGTVSLGSLASGATATVVLVVTPNAGAVPSITDTATIFSNQPPDPNTKNNSASVTTAVTPAADVAVTVSAPTSVSVGQNITYTINVTNNGPNDASGVVLTDTLPPLPTDGTFVLANSTVGQNPTLAGSTLTANIGGLAAGQTAQVTVVITPNANALPSIANTATVQNQVPDPDLTNNTASATTTITSTADVVVSVNPVASVPVGGTLTYTIKVTDNGPQDASSVVMTDTLPAGVTFVSATSTLGGPITNNNGVVTASIGTLHNGASDTIVITATPTPAATSTITNNAVVTTASTDTNQSNNSANTTTTVTPVASVSVGLAASATSAVVGQSLIYIATVTNGGPSAAPAVTLTDALPAGLSFVSATASNGTTPTISGSTLTAALGTLAVGASVSVQINTTAVQAAVPSVTNTVNVSTTATNPSATTSAGATTSVAPVDVLTKLPSPSIAPNVAGQPLSGVVVASFSDTNPAATAASFTATINWGDGTPATAGTVVPNGSGGVNVTGSHTYKSAPPNGASAFTITTTLTAASGASLQATNQVAVTVVPLTLTGQLNPASDSGVSHQDHITNISQPNFNGTSTPGAIITLYAQSTGGGSATPIGQTTADSSGFWNISANRPLSNGSFAITATANDSSGQSTTQTIVPASQPLVIDTSAPTVGTIVYNRAAGQLNITFHAGPAGLNAGTILNAAEYTFKSATVKKAGNLVVGVTAQPPSSGATTDTAVLTIKGGKKIKTGTYSLSILSSIQDVAGNSLGRNLAFAVKPGKSQVIPKAAIASATPAAKVQALAVHDAALSTLHATAKRHRRGK